MSIHEPERNREQIKTTLLDLERQYWQAIKDKDGETAMRLSADACIVTGAQGVGRIDRRSLGAMMKEPNYTLHEFELDPEAQVDLVAEDVAVVAYKVREKLTVDGKPVSLQAAEASVWVRRAGSWLCAHHSEAITGDPFGRDRRATA